MLNQIKEMKEIIDILWQVETHEPVVYIRAPITNYFKIGFDKELKLNLFLIGNQSPDEIDLSLLDFNRKIFTHQFDEKIFVEDTLLDQLFLSATQLLAAATAVKITLGITAEDDQKAIAELKKRFSNTIKNPDKLVEHIISAWNFVAAHPISQIHAEQSISVIATDPDSQLVHPHPHFLSSHAELIVKMSKAFRPSAPITEMKQSAFVERALLNALKCRLNQGLTKKIPLSAALTKQCIIQTHDRLAAKIDNDIVESNGGERKKLIESTIQTPQKNYTPFCMEYRNKRRRAIGSDAASSGAYELGEESNINLGDHADEARHQHRIAKLKSRQINN